MNYAKLCFAPKNRMSWFRTSDSYEFKTHQALWEFTNKLGELVGNMNYASIQFYRIQPMGIYR